MFRKLIIPLDGSPLAEQALGPAAAIARACNSALDLVLVHQPLSFAGFKDEPWTDGRISHEEKYLETIAAELTSGAGLPVTHTILEGEPSDMICRRISEIDAGLVIMTTHGRTGISRAWLGSIADRVLRHSPAPVLMLHPIEGKTRELAARHLFKKLLVPLDGSSIAAEIVDAASAFAHCADARVLLLRVVQPVPMEMPNTVATAMYAPLTYPFMAPDAAATNRLAAQASTELAETAQKFRDRDIQCDAHVVVADRVAQAILDAASGHGVDAIAMATSGRGASRLFMGSVADKVLRGSVLPMLVVRPLSVRETGSSTSRSEASPPPTPTPTLPTLPTPGVGAPAGLPQSSTVSKA